MSVFDHSLLFTGTHKRKRYTGRSRTTKWRRKKNTEEIGSSSVPEPAMPEPEQYQDEGTQDIHTIWIDTYPSDFPSESSSDHETVISSLSYVV